MKSGHKLVFVMILISSLFTLSCTSSTQSHSGNLVGTVNLINDTGDPSLDAIDFGGVTVALYELTTLDTALVRINGRYPTIGVLISQQTEFDHRLQNPIATGITNADGTFSLGNIPTGTYNIAIFKQGWGYRYLYNFAIVSGDNPAALPGKSGAIDLYPDLVLSGVIDGVTKTFDDRHQVVIADDTYFLENTSIIISPGAVLRLAPWKKLLFFGAVKMQGSENSPIRVTSNDATYSTVATTPSRFQSITFQPTALITDLTLSWIFVSDSETGVCLNQSSSVSNCVFYGADNALSISGSQTSGMSVNVSNSLIGISPDSPNYSTNVSVVSAALFEKCIFNGSAYGLYVTATPDLKCFNNYFNNGTLCIFLNQFVNATIRHNEIESDERGINTYYNITSEITFNNVYAKIGLQYRSYENVGIAQNNNLYCTQWGIDFVTNSPQLGNLQGQNNFWNTAVDEIVQQRINDKSDYPITEQFYDSLSYVDYQPFRSSKVANAGI